MIATPSCKLPGDQDRDADAVAALVQLLVDSGFQPNRIAAALRKPTTEANANRLSDSYPAAGSRGPNRRNRAA